ncbi:MAG: hypothetical protein ACI81L_001211 [Verrucomicrobiales bacterium]|jgi:hypothetical protein
MIAVILILHALAGAGLQGPSGLSRDALSTWTDSPVTVLATAARWAALVLAYYLAVVLFSVAVFGERAEASPVGRAIPAGLVSAIGLLLGTSAVALPLASHLTRPTPVSEQVTESASTIRLTRIDEPLELERLDALVSSTTPVTQTAANPVAPETVDADEIWPVASGDSFWTIAEETLRDSWGREDLSDREIIAYWKTLIEANQARLIEPGNPDLLLPGQELVLPPTPTS